MASGSRSSSLIGDRQHLEGVLEQDGGVGVVGQAGQYVTHLVGSVTQAGEGVADVGARRTRYRAVAVGRTRHALAQVGDREPRLQLDQQPLRRLLPDPGHEAERVDVVLRQHAGQRRRLVDRQDGQGQGRSDAVGPQQGAEAAALVEVDEPVQRLGVFPNVVMDEDEHLVAEVADRDRRGRADGHPVADAGDLDEDLVGAAVEEPSSERSDHRAPPVAARTRAASGAWAR